MMDHGENEAVACFSLPEGDIIVYPRCHCGRFLKHGTVRENGRGDVSFSGWTCAVHGEVRPDYERF